MSDITRRDFVNGTLVVAGTSMLPFGGMGQAAMAAFDPSYYPPKFTGLRGSHPGSNEHAHARAWEQKTDWGATSDLSETYDLVVVGGGISGLAAAYFYQREHGKDKKVLILENHDDFGGHAKRNEHDIDGDMRLGEGGSESIESPYGSSDLVMNLFEELGIDLDRFKTAYDANFLKNTTWVRSLILIWKNLVKIRWSNTRSVSIRHLLKVLCAPRCPSKLPLHKRHYPRAVRNNYCV